MCIYDLFFGKIKLYLTSEVDYFPRLIECMSVSLCVPNVQFPPLLIEFFPPVGGSRAGFDESMGEKKEFHLVILPRNREFPQ